MKSAKVINRESLLSHGNIALREKALDIIDYALMCADPYVKTMELVKIEQDGDHEVLVVGDDRFDLSYYKRIYVLGAGKATYPIAKALDEILGERITDGVVIIKHGEKGSLKHSRLMYGAHPVPDEAGHRGAVEIMKVIKQTKATDIIFSISTGGSTSMMPYPVEGVTLEDKKLTGSVLLRSGANVDEMNYVRSHLTQIKTGLMAKIIHPEAPILNLGVADAIGQGLDDCVEPTTAWFNSFDDAREVLTRFKLWDKVPASVADYIRNGTEEQEIPRDLDDHNIYNYLLVDVDAAVHAARAKAAELGFNSVVLTTFTEGESRSMGEFAGSIAMEVRNHNAPVAMPAALIIGGESNLKIDIPEPGEGGPNQQFVLAASAKLSVAKEKNSFGDGIVICGIDTDGNDGPTENAGGIIDDSTWTRAGELNMNIYEYMDDFNDGVCLRALDDLIITGKTGTNVNDLKMILVAEG